MKNLSKSGNEGILFLFLMGLTSLSLIFSKTSFLSDIVESVNDADMPIRRRKFVDDPGTQSTAQ